MTTTGLQVPGLGQAHKVCGGVKPVSGRPTLPLTWDSGTTAQQETNRKNQLNSDLTLEIDTKNITITNNTRDNKKYRPRKSTRIYCVLVQNPKATNKHPSHLN